MLYILIIINYKINNVLYTQARVYTSNNKQIVYFVHELHFKIIPLICQSKKGIDGIRRNSFLLQLCLSQGNMTRDFSFLTPSNMVTVHESFRILNENTLHARSITETTEKTKRTSEDDDGQSVGICFRLSPFLPLALLQEEERLTSL